MSMQRCGVMISLNARSMVAAIEEIAKVAGGNGRSVAVLGRTMGGQLSTVDEIQAASEMVSQLAAELDHSLTIFRTGSEPQSRAEAATPLYVERPTRKAAARREAVGESSTTAAAPLARSGSAAADDVPSPSLDDRF